MSTLKVRATKNGFTRELVLEKPGNEFELQDYTDLDGNLITAEDQFSSQWMERADAAPGSKEARLRKPLSPGAERALGLSRERASLRRGEAVEGAEPGAAVLARQEAIDRAQQATEAQKAKLTGGRKPSGKITDKDAI